MEKKVYPTPQELMKVNSLLHCTEEGCSSIFSSESNLNLHLIKTHKKENIWSTDKSSKEYHCPEISCIYNNQKFFKTLKLLKQHYLKVHAEKTFQCNSCAKTFSTSAACNSHNEYCGIMFKCCNCESSYPTYESLVTHARRKKHSCMAKAMYKSSNFLKKSKSTQTLMQQKLTPMVSTKGSVSLQDTSLKRDSIFTFEKGNQTEEVVKSLTNSASQTNVTSKPQLCSETQTVGDYITKNKKSIEDLIIFTDENAYRKSTKTQTQPVDLITKSCNTSFKLNDFEFIEDIKVERNSSSTQTITSIPTEFIYSTVMENEPKDFNFDIDSLDKECFFNCNTETQTDFIFDNDLTSDYYSNMYTQTCDDILLNELGFNSSQTQTAIEDMLRSVESQTMMSHNSKTFMTCRDMAHMETQTDIEFKQMLEEINA